MKMNSYPTLYTKINSERITDLNVRPKTTKLVEENKTKQTIFASLTLVS